MEYALSTGNVLSLEAWVAFAEAIGRDSVTVAAEGLNGGPRLPQVADALLAMQAKDVLRLSSLPAVERALRSLPLGGAAHTWSRVADLACQQEWATAASVPDLPLAAARRVLALAMLGFFEEHAALATQWEREDVVITDEELARAAAKMREGTRRREFNFFVHVAGSMAHFASAKTRSGVAVTDGANGVCTLRSVKGVWKQSSSYPRETEAERVVVYGGSAWGGARRERPRCGLLATLIGLLLLGAVAAFSTAVLRLRWSTP